MTEKIFGEMAEQMRPSNEVRSDLFARIEADGAPAAPSPGEQEPAAPAPSPAGHPRRLHRWFLGAAAAVVAASLLIPAIGGADAPSRSDPIPSSVGAGAASGDYGALYAAVLDASRRSAAKGWRTGMAAGVSDTGLAWAGEAVPAAAPAANESLTNTQVEGIDESDIVKSDGRTLFVAKGKEVVLLAAAGAATRELARINTENGGAAPSAKDGLVLQGPVVDLMVSGSTLVVFVTEYRARESALGEGVVPGTEPTAYVPFDASQTKALLYDITDPTAPRLRTSLGQSGAMTTSRLVGSLLYLVTEYVVTDPDAIKADDAKTFVPALSEGTRTAAMKASNCWLVPQSQGPHYTVVTSIDVAAAKRVDAVSVLGGSQTVSMSTSNLYLAATINDAPAADLVRAGAPKDITSTALTQLTRIALADDGQLSLAAQGSIPGSVLNQFALDEYQDHLRVATTIAGQNRKKRWVERTALYVLDAQLKTVGSLPSLVKNETVQSVRFLGQVGYVVTFKQVDPLFTVDLRDPAKPVVLSALKVPGFSAYLHSWGEGRLLGFGRQGNSKGETNGLKLSMFDTSDRLAVAQITAKEIRFDGSEALSNHHAILVAPDSGLIGVPVTLWSGEKQRLRYLVYRYQPQTGFELAKKIALNTGNDGRAPRVRGLLIDNHLYLASAVQVKVLSIADFGEAATVTLKN